MSRVLVVDDAAQLVRALRLNLRARGYEVDTAGTAHEALALASERPPDLVILDLGLPDSDGRNVIGALRTWTNVPIIVLSGRTDQRQKIAALEAGADDYVTKPFGVDELIARMRAVARRVVTERHPDVVIGDWVVDLSAHRVRPASGEGADQHLTPTEWTILEALISNPGRLVTRSQLLRAVWGTDYDPETSSLRLYIAQLRRKLEPAPGRPRFILTEPGLGYRFVTGQPASEG